MILKSEIRLSKAEIESIILDHLKNNNKHNLKIGRVSFSVRESDECYGNGYSPADLEGASISVELELDDGREDRR